MFYKPNYRKKREKKNCLVAYNLIGCGRLAKLGRYFPHRPWVVDTFHLMHGDCSLELFQYQPSLNLWADGTYDLAQGNSVREDYSSTCLDFEQ